MIHYTRDTSYLATSLLKTLGEPCAPQRRPPCYWLKAYRVIAANFVAAAIAGAMVSDFLLPIST